MSASRLTAAEVRATMYADHAEALAEAATTSDGPDTLTQACHHEAYFILDRYGQGGYRLRKRDIRILHDDLVAAGVEAARGAMIGLAARRLDGTRRIEA